MNHPCKKNFRTAVLILTICIATTLIASPAFSRDRRHCAPRYHHGSHNGRIFHDSDFLPALLATTIIAGITYSIVDSVTNPPVREYRAVDRAYAYTPAVPMVRSGSIMVTAQLLNVRTRPSLDAPLMVQIPYGTVLSVSDSAPGWYYVDLPGNRCGWVMAQFTEPVGYSGAG